MFLHAASLEFAAEPRGTARVIGVLSKMKLAALSQSLRDHGPYYKTNLTVFVIRLFSKRNRA